VGAMTINKVCGSGLKAVALAAQAIEIGNSSILVAKGAVALGHPIGASGARVLVTLISR